MKVESAIAKPGEDARRHDFGRHERDQPRPRQLIETERSQIVAGFDRHHRQLRIMPKQQRPQHRPLHLTRKKNDDVEHALPGLATAVCVLAWLRSGS